MLLGKDPDQKARDSLVVHIRPKEDQDVSREGTCKDMRHLPIAREAFLKGPLKLLIASKAMDLKPATSGHTGMEGANHRLRSAGQSWSGHRMLSPLAICVAHAAEGERPETDCPPKKRPLPRPCPQNRARRVHHVAESLPLPPLSIKDLVNTPKAYQNAVYHGGAPKLPRTIW